MSDHPTKMSGQSKNIEEIEAADLRTFPVWQYTNDDGNAGETTIRPIKKLPVKNLIGRIVGTQVRLANSTNIWALIGNVDINNARLTRHFLTLSVLWSGRWFTLARYHDVDAEENGPQALATFLGLRTDEIFPISYDVSRFSLGIPDALTGIIEKVPREKLTRAEIIALAVP
jgi:hypothetical protein